MSARYSTFSSSSETEGTTVDAPVPHYRQESPTASHSSTFATGTPYDTLSIATTTNTGFTNVTANTSASQQQVTGGGVPIIRPPALQQQQQQQVSGPGTNVTNQQIQIDVATAKQHTVQSETNVSSTKFGGGGASLGQQHHAQTGNQTNEHFQYQQTQFANQTSGQQSFNALLDGGGASQDFVLNIDYGVIEAYNVAMQSAGDLTDGQSSGGFDVAKAMFKQADTNHDDSISRDEFRQWPQGGMQNSSTQSYSNHQTTTNYGNNFNNAQLHTNNNPDIANILQQSGLGQAYGNY